MTALADSKLSALETLTGLTGTLQDLEQAYLLLLVTGPVTASTIHDLWFQVFDEASIPAGQFNDRWYAYMDFILAPATFDHYNEREREYWDGGGTPIGPPAPIPPELATLQHWFDFTDSTTMFTDVAGTIPVAVSGDVIRHIANKGTDGTPLIQAGSAMTYEPGVVNSLSVGRWLTTEDINATIAAAGGAGWTMAGVTRRNSGDPVAGTEAFFDWGASNMRFVGQVGTAFHISFGTLSTGVAAASNEWVGMYFGGDVVDSFARQSGAAEIVTGATSGATVGAGSLLRVGEVIGAFPGENAEMLVYSSKLSPADRALLFAYFDAKYGTLPFLGLPPTVVSLMHHYDLTDNATVFKNPPATQIALDGDPIRVVKDKGFNAADLSTPSTAASPTYRTSFVNGQNVADFVGGATSKPLFGTDGPGHLGIKGMSNAVVFRLPDALGPLVDLVDWGFGVGRLVGSRDFGIGVMKWDYPGAVAGLSLGVIIPGNWYLWYASVTGVFAGSDDRMRLSGEASQSLALLGPADIAPGEPIELSHVTSQNIFIAEWAVWDGPLTDPELAQLTAFADAKYGTLPHA